MWQRWLAFSINERSQLLLLCSSLFWVRLRLKFMRLDKLIAWAESRNSRCPKADEPASPPENSPLRSSARSDAINSLLGSVCRFQGLSNVCLPRALVLCRWLNQEGIPARVRIGVAKPGTGDAGAKRDALGDDEEPAQEGSFRAHAWVEVDGYSSDKTVDKFSQFSNLQARGG